MLMGDVWYTKTFHRDRLHASALQMHALTHPRLLSSWLTCNVWKLHVAMNFDLILSFLLPHTSDKSLCTKDGLGGGTVELLQ